jgi:hypothetical protein
MCGEQIARSALRCPHCGEDVEQSSRSRERLEPHRGGMILAFGIVGLVCCFPFSIAAWVMGNADLEEMDRGRMDDSGRGLTLAGKIIGIVQLSLMAFGILIYAVMILIAVLGAANAQ